MNPPNNQNSQNGNQYSESESDVLNLEILSMRYQNLLNEYQLAISNYMDFLKQEDSSSQQFITVNNSAYWGTSGVGQINSTTSQQCQASCSSTNGCTGATYNSGNSTCFLRGGDSTITAASDTEIAIVTKGQQLLSIIQNINIQLTGINQQIQNISNNAQPIYSSQVQQGQTQTTNLISQFIQLTQEREKLDELVNEYKNLDQEQIEGGLVVNQNYYSFLLLLALAIIIIIFLYYFNGSTTSSTIPSLSPENIQTGGRLGRSAYYFLFGIVLLTVLISNFGTK